MNRFIFLFLLVTLFALPAGATWNTEPAGAGKVRTIAKPGTFLWYDFSDAADSGILDTRQCRGGVSIVYNSDVAGVTHTATIRLQACVLGSGTAANLCENVLSDAGDTALTGQGELGTALVFGPNLKLPFVRIDVIANAGAESGRVALACEK